MKTNQGYNLEIEENARELVNKKDIALIARIAKGDESALEQLYLSYYNRLLRFITRTTGRADQVEEVINEVMYVVWQKAETYNQSCQPSTWIFGIAYNKARKSIRETRFDKTVSLEVMDIESTLFGQHNAELKQFELHNLIEYALNILSSEQRMVVELTYFQGLHYSEIAELMTCPVNTVKTRMFHARKKLATILSSHNNLDLTAGGKQ
jgi:RNA polymerase sigma-70 factor (ECF subfamily)